jgi:ATP-dependent phosphofructokinase / diphosphate-dependent phosphofructokinase
VQAEIHLKSNFGCKRALLKKLASTPRTFHPPRWSKNTRSRLDINSAFFYTFTTMNSKKVKSIGILTSGGDCPGLNSAIRGVAKAALHHGIRVVGFQDGFRGLVENRVVNLEALHVSGILTLGGTILGSSRDKPRKMNMGGEIMDMTKVAIQNAIRNHVDCLVCLGGNGTQKNALHLAETGELNVITLPKTIDNDVYGTDISFGFDTAMNIATEAVDRLHTTATSHHRIIVCEVMGHKAGWLALGTGIAGGADVILLPEIPYNIDIVAEHLKYRRRTGRRFSIIVVAEGARAQQTPKVKASGLETESDEDSEDTEKKTKKKRKEQAVTTEDGSMLVEEPMASRIAREIQQRTGIEARVTSLGHVQRGGSPSAADRLLCTRLGTCVGDLLIQRHFNVMVSVKGSQCTPVPLKEVAGKTKFVELDHDWIQTARYVETCLGDLNPHHERSF